LYRGLCYSFIGDQTVANFPDSFLNIGLGTIGSTPIPVQLVIFLVFAVIYGLLLHRTTFGRFTYAIGQNEEGCRFSGVPVDRTKIIIFSLNGLMAAVAGIILAARFTSVRVDAGLGYELDVITAVVLGGVDIAGGSGTIFGVVLSLFLLGLIRYGMSLLNISGQIQSIAVGCMLIIAILVPYVTRQIRQKTRKQQLVE
jgi:rhamnose transport system permease protein